MSNRYRMLTAVLLAVGMIVFLAACGNTKQLYTSDPESTMEPAQTDNAQNDMDNETMAEQTAIQLAFGYTVMTAVLDNSETSRAFIKMLPLTLTMNRYADREYYSALGELPKNGVAIDDFENGDVTYYTDGKSLAIFFANADTSSQDGLIRMGRITSDLSLFDTVGESAEVTISLLGSETDMTNFDFSVFDNVEITGINISELRAEEQAVLYQQARYCQAMTKADTKTMREITSPDMIFTHMSGRQQTRDEYFADIENGDLQYFTIGIENPVVNINGNYASVSYTSVLNANAYGAGGTYRMDGIHWYKIQNKNWIACNTPER